MVFLEPKSLGTAPMVQSWVAGTNDIFMDVRPALIDCFDTYLSPAINFIKKQTTEPIEAVPNNLARSLMNLLDSIMLPLIPIEGV
jgi:hypothetical protein